MSKPQAILLALAEHGAMTAAEIVKATGLRQQEVSKSCSNLKYNRGLVDRTTVTGKQAAIWSLSKKGIRYVKAAKGKVASGPTIELQDPEKLLSMLGVDYGYHKATWKDFVRVEARG